MSCDFHLTFCPFLLKCIYIHRLFKCSEKENAEGDDSDAPLELSRYSLPNESFVNVVDYVPLNDFLRLDDVSKLSAQNVSHVIHHSTAYYLGVLMKLFLGKATQHLLFSAVAERWGRELEPTSTICHDAECVPYSWQTFWNVNCAIA